MPVGRKALEIFDWHTAGVWKLADQITGPLLFGFFTVGVRFFHILRVPLSGKQPASAIQLQQRKGLLALQGISKIWKVVCWYFVVVRKMMNPKHFHRSSLNVQEAHRPDCSGSCCSSSSWSPASRWH
jgi:hypothetical protein